MTRALVLRKETLSELTDDQLGGVVGAAITQICITNPCITPVSGLQCLSARLCG
jgi:hypothetical protein